MEKETQQEEKKQKALKDLCKKYLCNSLAISVFLSFTLNFIIECLGRKSIGAALSYMVESPLIFLYNFFIIFLTMSIALLVKRRVFVYALVSTIWLALGITNGVMLGYRVTPFTAVDITLLQGGMNIIRKYMSVTQIILLVIGFVVAAVLFTLLFIYGPKTKKEIKFVRNFITIIVLCVCFFGLSKYCLAKGMISTKFGNIAFAYLDYGVPYCFTITMIDTGIDEPQNYSEEEVLKLKTELDQTTTSKKAKKPNIIFIQLESLFDPTLVKGLELSEDPIPNLRKLYKNYSSGYLNVPSVGAGTANTEFEAISGMSIRQFGAGEYPYKTILRKKTCESTAYDLKNLGYTTHAIHNNTASFYGRNEVFPNLGFDTFTPVEFMCTGERTQNGWVKDKVLTEYIMDCLRSSKKQDYIYAISVQGHGSYPTVRSEETPNITVSGENFTEEQLAGIEYYVNQINEMDQFVGELIKNLTAYGEDTVLVMYGDHLPSLGFTEEDMKNNSLYQTEYVIWDNIGLKKKNQTLYSYQIAAEVMNRLGIHEGNIAKLHQKMRNTSDYLERLRMLSYDILYGENYLYNGVTFAATDMQMGIKHPKIYNVFANGSGIYVTGENLTEKTKVYVNGEKVPVEYSGRRMLRLDIEEIKTGDIVTLKLTGGRKTVLFVSDEFVVNVDDDATIDEES